jgi:hypothetical protein
MFDSLDERIKRDEMNGPKERVLRYVVVAIVSVAIFAGLYEAVRLLG